jgi:Putative beta-barrel porin 2
MKKIAVSVGLVAVGTASLQAAYTLGSDSMQTSKVWSLSGSLRGFYDDNYNTAPSGSPSKRGSYGFEFSPSISLNLPLDQTDIGARYTYGLYFYQDRLNLHPSQNPVDQTHQLDLWVNHAFTESWQVSFQDSFVSAQDPSLVDGGTFLRSEGNNINNTGSIKLDTQWTRLLGSEFGYQNTFVDYQAHGGTAAAPSFSGLLDRDENLVWLDVNWTLTPELKPLVGYKFGQVNYLGDEPIAPGNVSDNRDSRSQYFYVGALYNPLANLTLSVEAGGQYVDYYRPAPGLSATTQFEPYANLSGTYTYLPGSYVQAGFTQTQSATDVSAPTASGQVTESLNTSTVYASINHQFSPKLTASAIGKVQYSTFNEGAFANSTETWYSLGLNLAYNLNNHISTEIGYNYDNLDSNVPGQKYDRNRVYLGVTAIY